MATKSLEEILAENTELTANLGRVTTELNAEKGKVTDLTSQLATANTTISGINAKATENATALEAANKELAELRAKDMDVERRAAAKVKAAGIAAPESKGQKADEPKLTAGGHKPGSWQAEAEAKFSKAPDAK